MQVHLAELTKNNWEECAGLVVREDQRDFVDPNLFCIAGSRFEPGWRPLAVYRDGTMVGMIDACFQGGGLGRTALLASIEPARSSGAGCEIKLSHHLDNPAVTLYESVGFEHTDEEWGTREPVMALKA